MSKQRIAVIFGGMSSEHDISLVTATTILQNIPSDKYEVLPIGITKKGRWLYFPGDFSMIKDGSWEEHPDCVSCILSPDPMHKGFLKILEDGSSAIMKVDCIFPALHGKNGEDGTIQGLFSLSKIPYVGCDVISSANCMDKAVTHTLLRNAGVKVTNSCVILARELPKIDEKCEEITQKLKFPLFVKPANAGSSIGITKVLEKSELKTAIKFAFTHDKKVVIEEGIVGKEVECAVMGNNSFVVSSIGEIAPVDGFYDFEGKYKTDDCKCFIPARISNEICEKIRENSLKAYNAVGCKGLARVDSFLTENGEIYLNEINTLPGFTPISMYHKLMSHSGIELPELLEKLIDLAFERAE